eukprot:NODE_2615_length_2179_cov_7.925926.p1 GENE.NODE_2615_length_2179_cov_7.925926~~NODE_2615_length_2179_cov_7.925926.p1  ORF type:complete len:567 (+),score=109.33 NODE_2615_length_2179_cov_7.925926:87-1703(+)
MACARQGCLSIMAAASGVFWDAPSCDFERLDGRSLSASELAARRWPTVLTGLLDEWPAQQAWHSAGAFAALHGDVVGYARDHDQMAIRDVEATVAGYLGHAEVETTHRESNSSAFFMNDYEDGRLFDHLRGAYAVPPPLHGLGALSVFALERPGTGVAFHRHETAWQALVGGQKRWFLMPPATKVAPQHSPCIFLSEGPPPLALQCTVGAGEVMYVPEDWWHATCSLAPEASIAVGGVGNTTAWPATLLAARHGAGAATATVDAHVRLPPGQGVFAGGEDALYMAAAFGHAELVGQLLGLGMSPDVPRRDGRTALHEAARRGDLHVVELLLRAGADIHLSDLAGSTALHHACAERGNPDVVRHLLDQGMHVAEKQKDGRGVLHVACHGRRDPVQVLRILLETSVLSPSQRDDTGVTPLMHCAASGHRRAVGLLLRLGGPQASLYQDDAGRDALSHALAGRGDVGVVTRLLAAGLPAKHGDRAAAAARCGEFEALRVLAAAGAPMDGAVLVAAEAGNAAVLEVLIGVVAAAGGTPRSAP